MNKGLILGLIFIILLSNITYAIEIDIKEFFDIATTLKERARTVKDLGILEGTNKGLELEKGMTRAEGATMITRLGGYPVRQYKNEEGVYVDHVYDFNFDDVPDWAYFTVGYLERHGKIKGITETEFGSNKEMSARDFFTMILRVLEYDD